MFFELVHCYPGGYFPCQKSWFTEKYLLCSLKKKSLLLSCLSVLIISYMTEEISKYFSAVGSVGDGTAPPEELRRALGYSYSAGHPVSEQAD